MFGLKEANSVLTKLNKEMNLEKVEQLLEDSADAIAYQKVRLFLQHLLCCANY